MSGPAGEREAGRRSRAGGGGGVSIAVPAHAAVVEALRRAVTRLAAEHGAPRDALWRIDLAVCEACTNVVLHAYPDTPGELRLHADVRRAVLAVTVADDGVTASAGRGGLGIGLWLMRRLADAVVVERAARGHGTVVRMRFALDRRPAPGGAIAPPA